MVNRFGTLPDEQARSIEPPLMGWCLEDVLRIEVKVVVYARNRAGQPSGGARRHELRKFLRGTGSCDQSVEQQVRKTPQCVATIQSTVATLSSITTP